VENRPPSKSLSPRALTPSLRAGVGRESSLIVMKPFCTFLRPAAQ
jgi:hypothetical protein